MYIITVSFTGGSVVEATVPERAYFAKTELEADKLADILCEEIDKDPELYDYVVNVFEAKDSSKACPHELAAEFVAS